MLFTNNYPYSLTFKGTSINSQGQDSSVFAHEKHLIILNKVFSLGPYSSDNLTQKGNIRPFFIIDKTTSHKWPYIGYTSIPFILWLDLGYHLQITQSLDILTAIPQTNPYRGTHLFNTSHNLFGHGIAPFLIVRFKPW